MSNLQPINPDFPDLGQQPWASNLLTGLAESVVAENQTRARVNAFLLHLAKNPDMLVTGAITGDPVTSAVVVWPGGAPGVLTITARHTSGAVTSYTITYGSPVTQTFTQPAITRNAAGAATLVPAIVVT